MVKMKIRQALDVDRERWDEFVHSCPESTPYHLSAWTVAVSNAYGFESCSLIAEEGNKIVGVCPLIVHGGLVTKKSLVALPFCDLGAILATNSTVTEQLSIAALKEAQADADEATIGLLVDRITIHEKNAWMLRSMV